MKKVLFDTNIILDIAFSLELIDFEDAVQISASELNRIEPIIPRNKAGFRNTSLEVITPKDFLNSIQ